MDLGFAAAEDDDEWSEGNRPPATPAFPDVEAVTIQPVTVTVTDGAQSVDSDKADHDTDVSSEPVMAAVTTPDDMESEPNFCSEPMIGEVPALSILTETPGVIPLAQAQVLYSSEDDVIEPPAGTLSMMPPPPIVHIVTPEERDRIMCPPPTGLPPTMPSIMNPVMRRGPPANPIHENEWTRYFVIKSNSHKNLVLSIENNVWATQPHNECRFNDAFDRSPYVVLLFSVNQSGRFQGYARMMSHVGSCEKDVFNGFGRPFNVKWLKLHDLDFQDLQSSMYDNPWNEGKNIRISRDGQEVPREMGASICQLIDQQVYELEPDEYPDDIEDPNPFKAPISLTENNNQARLVQQQQQQNQQQQGNVQASVQSNVWHPPTQSMPSQDPRWRQHPYPMPYPPQGPIYTRIDQQMDPRMHQDPRMHHERHRKAFFPNEPIYRETPIYHQPQFAPPRRPPMSPPRTSGNRRPSSRGYEEPRKFYRDEERRRESPRPNDRKNARDAPPVDVSRMSYAEYRKWHANEQRLGGADSDSSSSPVKRGRDHKRKRSRSRHRR